MKKGWVKPLLLILCALLLPAGLISATLFHRQASAQALAREQAEALAQEQARASAQAAAQEEAERLFLVFSFKNIYVYLSGCAKS